MSLKEISFTIKPGSKLGISDYRFTDLLATATEQVHWRLLAFLALIISLLEEERVSSES